MGCNILGVRTHHVTFSLDGHWLETESLDGTVRLIETATGKEVDRMATGDGVRAAAFSPNGDLLATGNGDGTVRLMRVNP